MASATASHNNSTAWRTGWTLLLALYGLVFMVNLVIYGYLLFAAFQAFFATVMGLSLVLDVFALHGFTAYVKQRPVRTRRWQTLYLAVAVLLGLRFLLLLFVLLDNWPPHAHGQQAFLLSLLLIAAGLVVPPMVALFRHATANFKAPHLDKA